MSSSCMEQVIAHFWGHRAPLYISDDFGIQVAVYRVTAEDRRLFLWLTHDTITLYGERGAVQSP